MKQFQYVSSRTGTVFGPYDEDRIREMDHRVQHVLTLPPGQTWTDHEGDVWSRADGAASPDERLERIAAVALQGLIASGLPINEGPAAQRAIVYAKALIAELDKQA